MSVGKDSPNYAEKYLLTGETPYYVSANAFVHSIEELKQTISAHGGGPEEINLAIKLFLEMSYISGIFPNFDHPDVA